MFDLEVEKVGWKFIEFEDEFDSLNNIPLLILWISKNFMQ